MKSKKIVALIVAFAAFMAVATSGLAATTTTTYLGDKVTVSTTIAAQAGKEVTYLVKSNNQIIYIDQKTVENDGSVTFDYKIAKDKLVDYASTVQFGTDGEAITDTENTALLFDDVNVTSDAGVKTVTFHADEECETSAVANAFGNGDNVWAKIELVDNYEFATVTLNGEDVKEDAPIIKVSMGQTLAITTKKSVVAPKVEADDMVIENTVLPKGEEPIDTDKYAVKTIAMKITGAPQYVGVVVGDTLYRALPGDSGVYSADAVYAVRIITDKNDVIDNYELYVDEE